MFIMIGYIIFKYAGYSVYILFYSVSNVVVSRNLGTIGCVWNYIPTLPYMLVQKRLLSLSVLMQA